jgi:hypothetical protein
MTEPKRPDAPKDIAILNGPTDDGQGARVVRIRKGEVSAGEIRPVKEGESINQSEVVRLKPLDQEQRVCEIEVLHAPPGEPAEKTENAKDKAPRRRSHTPGPVRVSNPTYRKNWSAIFESKNKRDWSVN